MLFTYIYKYTHLHTHTHLHTPTHLGLYCSGWLKKGPVGVIMTTMNEAFDTANSLLEDLATDQLTSDPSHRGHRDISDLLEQKGYSPVTDRPLFGVNLHCSNGPNASFKLLLRYTQAYQVIDKN